MNNTKIQYVEKKVKIRKYILRINGTKDIRTSMKHMSLLLSQITVVSFKINKACSFVTLLNFTMCELYKITAEIITIQINYKSYNKLRSNNSTNRHKKMFI